MPGFLFFSSQSDRLYGSTKYSSFSIIQVVSRGYSDKNGIGSPLQRSAYCTAAPSSLIKPASQDCQIPGFSTRHRAPTSPAGTSPLAKVLRQRIVLPSGTGVVSSRSADSPTSHSLVGFCRIGSSAVNATYNPRSCICSSPI